MAGEMAKKINTQWVEKQLFRPITNLVPLIICQLNHNRTSEILHKVRGAALRSEENTPLVLSAQTEANREEMETPVCARVTSSSLLLKMSFFVDEWRVYSS